MLTIDIQLNGRRIAAARLKNISNLADLSDYEVETREDAFPDADLPAGRADFTLRNQPRLRTVWCIVAAMARRAAAIREQDIAEITDAS
jgi:hypothetical protein